MFKKWLIRILQMIEKNKNKDQKSKSRMEQQIEMKKELQSEGGGEKKEQIERGGVKETEEEEILGEEILGEEILEEEVLGEEILEEEILEEEILEEEVLGEEILEEEILEEEILEEEVLGEEILEEEILEEEVLEEEILEEEILEEEILEEEVLEEEILEEEILERDKEDLDSKKPIPITALILCYNGENYIEKRLQSILDQEEAPLEILLLDDASTDETVAKAENILKTCSIPYRIIINKENVGCKEQICKGIEESKGDYIWFAEQDDYCSTNYLSSIIVTLQDLSVQLAYSKSYCIDENYQLLKGYFPQEQKERYCVKGTLEVESKLCISNTIPSMSAVTIKKSALEGIHEYIRQCEIFFDWMVYAYVLRQGNICFDVEATNYFMRHSKSIISKQRKNPHFYDDIFAVKNFIFQNYEISNENLLEMLYEIERDYRRNGCEGFESPDILDHPVLAIKYRKLQNKINEKIYK